MSSRNQCRVTRSQQGFRLGERKPFKAICWKRPAEEGFVWKRGRGEKSFDNRKIVWREVSLLLREIVESREKRFEQNMHVLALGKLPYKWKRRE